MELEKIIKSLKDQLLNCVGNVEDVFWIELISSALALVFLIFMLTVGLWLFTWYMVLILSFAMLLTIYERCVLNDRTHNHLHK